MYNDGLKYDTIALKLKVIPSHISNVVTGEKFKELFFYLYPDGNNPNLRNKEYKHINLTKKEKEFLEKEVKKQRLFGNIRKDFSKKFKPISRSQFDRYAKKNNFKTPYFVNLNKEHISLIKQMRKDGFTYKNIALKLNEEGISITRPTVQAKLRPFNL